MQLIKNKLPYIGICLALLPLMFFRDYTPDNELRYLSIADEALRNGTFFTFTNHGIIYADKPPLYFWFIMFAKFLLGKHYMLLLSMMSLIPALIIVHTMDKWIKYTNEEMRLTGGLMLLSCGLFLGMTVILRMDMLMCMFITLALRSFYEMLTVRSNSKKHSYLFPIYIFLAIFSKGPIGLLIPLFSTTTFLVFTKRWRSISKYWGIKTWGILLVGCTIWFICVYVEGGASYLNNLLFHQTVDRAVNSFHHKQPPYYYLISVWYSMLPWSILIIGSIITAIYRKKIGLELQRFFLTIIATTLIILSLISSKIDVYLLPIFPFAVYLTISLSEIKWNHWLAISVAIPSYVFILTTPTLFYLAHQTDTHYMGNLLFYIAACVLSVSGVFSLYTLYYKKLFLKAIREIVFGLFCAIFIGSWAMPKINSELGYGELCRKAIEIGNEQHLSNYAVYDISRPENMDVYLQRNVHVTTLDDINSKKIQNTILMIPTKSIKLLNNEIIKNRIYTVGNYSIIKI